MNDSMRHHLESQGIRVGAMTIVPCRFCTDKEQYDKAQRSLAAGEPDYGDWNRTQYYHPWHGESKIVQFAKGHKCLCRGCGGIGTQVSTQMYSPQK